MSDWASETVYHGGIGADEESCSVEARAGERRCRAVGRA